MRLLLDTNVAVWLLTGDRPRITKPAVTAMHTAAVEHLPWHHRDPLDRLLVAQAVVDGCAIVTADPRIAACEVETVW